MRILQVEDDSSMAMMTELMLRSEGFNIYTTDLGEEAVDLAKAYDYDLITLDLNLPDISGLDVLRQIRAAQLSTPVLVLTGAAGIETKLKCFGLGADDYLTKPFHKDELVARIHAVVRRSKGHAQSVIKTGDITVNLDAKTVEVNGARVHLTGKEYQVMELLALRLGTTLTKEVFLNHLYGGMDEPELKIIDVFICKLRRKLAAATGGRHFIETVWGRGYVLRPGGVAPPPAGLDDRTNRIYKPFPLYGRVLSALNEKALGFRELHAKLGGPSDRLRARVCVVMEMGLARNIGSPRQGLYTLTEAGRAWLSERLPTPETAAA